MNRAGVVLLLIAVAGLTLPGAAYSQVVPTGNRASVMQPAVDGAQAADRLDPAVSSLVFLGSQTMPVVSSEEMARRMAPLPRQEARNRGGIPYMIAGGALFVAGLIAGGDAGTILMIGGGGVGAYGLFLYF